jgi:hypothetical protein
MMALFLSLYCAESILLFVSVVASKKLMNALAIGAGVSSLGILVCGFLIVPSHMNTFWWTLHVMSYQTYFYQVLIYNDILPRTFRIESCPITDMLTDECKQTGYEILKTFEADHVDIRVHFAILLCMAIFWRVLTAVVLMCWQRPCCKRER